jgi:hypothetical protein
MKPFLTLTLLFVPFLTQLGNNELLLDHLDLLIESLQVHIVKFVYMLEKNPRRG